MAAMALGFTTPDGLLPALYASTVEPPSIFANAWLIWLRLLFSMQTKRIFFFIFFIPLAKARGNLKAWGYSIIQNYKNEADWLLFSNNKVSRHCPFIWPIFSLEPIILNPHTS